MGIPEGHLMACCRRKIFSRILQNGPASPVRTVQAVSTEKHTIYSPRRYSYENTVMGHSTPPTTVEWNSSLSSSIYEPASSSNPNRPSHGASYAPDTGYNHDSWRVIAYCRVTPCSTTPRRNSAHNREYQGPPQIA